MERIDEILYYSIIFASIFFTVFISLKFGNVVAKKINKYF